MTDTHRVTHKRIRRGRSGTDIDDDVIIEEGETFTPTEDELRAFGDRIEKLHVEEADESDEEEDVEEDEEEE